MQLLSAARVLRRQVLISIRSTKTHTVTTAEWVSHLPFNEVRYSSHHNPVVQPSGGLCGQLQHESPVRCDLGALETQMEPATETEKDIVLSRMVYTEEGKDGI